MSLLSAGLATGERFCPTWARRSLLSFNGSVAETPPKHQTVMANKFSIYWYNEDRDVAGAFLYNCRDSDLRSGGTGIKRGDLVLGAVGVVSAERDVPHRSGKKLAFKPSRRCEWQGFELECMVHPDLPATARTKAEVRPFNYIVAELPDAHAKAKAAQLRLPIQPDSKGRILVNLECATFQRQGNGSPRRAKLL